MLLGVLTTTDTTIATGSVIQSNGETYKEIAAIVAPDVFQAMALVMADTRALAIRQLQIFTNDKALLGFLTRPIKVKPTAETKIKPLFRPFYPLISVPTGGDQYQWNILHGLLYFNRWQIKFVAKLPNTEQIYSEYLASGQGKARRLEQGVWV